MKTQVFVTIIAAVSLLGVSAAALADDRDRDGGWRLDPQYERDRDGKHERDRHKRPDKIAREKEKHDRHKGKPDKHANKERDKHKDRYKRPETVIIFGDRDRHDRDRWRHDDRHDYYGHDWSERWQYGNVPDWYDWNRGLARVISVVPVHKVIGKGRHCRGDYGLGDWIEFKLGDLVISTGGNNDECYYFDREVRKHYRVTYRYKGRLHTVRMHRHPGKYVRVNRHGELIRGRH
jgi:hypothetical protein